MPRIGDAFGELLLDLARGREAMEIVERDDGFVWAGEPRYLDEFRDWPQPDRAVIRFARGRVLDVGAGAGRMALHLQRRGHPVAAIDASPGAVDVARQQGVVDARLLRLQELGGRLGQFQTILMLGNNFGLLQSRERSGSLWRRLNLVSARGARLLVSSNDPTHPSQEPADAAYAERNLARGRLRGQWRLRIRHRDLATPWFDYLFVSPEEMAELASVAGWTIRRTFREKGAHYSVLLERTA